MSKAILETLRYNMRQSLNGGHLRDAEDILGRLKREDPLSRETRGLELEFYLAANRLSEADALARQLCLLFPESGRIFFLAGKLAYRQKHYEEAAVRFRESQRLYSHSRTRHWLGKTLTQLGRFEEAESLLISAGQSNPRALLDLAWLHERKNDLEEALRCYEDFLSRYPDNSFANEQRVRIKARMLEPEALIEEVNALAELGEEVSDAYFPEFVQRLFETGQSLRARDEIAARLEKMDSKTGVRMAWVCYQAQAYDLACTLFLAYLQENTANYKYLNALESAADKCGRLSGLVESYRALTPQAPHLFGRCRTLSRKLT